ncbi:MAG: phosphotransferase enzyme family protein [Bacteriovoracaceae bacterium]
MKTCFENATYLSQVRRLRSLAEQALKQFPIGKHELRFINHGENTTFKVLTRKKNYLFRIHCLSHRTKKAFLEELKWLDFLSRTTDIPVQRPIASNEGSFLVLVQNEKVGIPRYCDLLEWQEGHIKTRKTPQTFFEVGKLIGQLQANTIKSKYRNYWDTKGLVGKEATLGGIPAMAKDFPKQIKKLEAQRKLLYKKISRYEKRNPDKLSLIHADLHFGNMIWNKGSVRPIDFDDCGYGLELYDLAVNLSSNYFLKTKKQESSLSKEALLNGYQEHKTLTEEDIKILPYLVAARELAMTGWLYEKRDNPMLHEFLKKNLSKRIKRTERIIKEAEIGKYF